MKLVNIGKINYNNENLDNRAMNQPQINKYTPNNVWALRCPLPTPTNFRQEILTNVYGKDFLDKTKKVLEIGFGCGRNAQFFVKEKHIHYYGFDASSVGLKYFKAQGFPEDRFYASTDIDETILNQEYDFIFSTFVLHHIGFSENQDVYDATRITKKLFPLLKTGGYYMAFEGKTGDNGWNCSYWYSACFPDQKFPTTIKSQIALEGCGVGTSHNLYLIQKV